MAALMVIPKEGKDPQLCQSYRTISLINTDAKIFAKLIAQRLNPLLPDIIYLDQVGFVPHREAQDNTLKTFSLLHQIRTSKIPCMLLSLDAEKAFGRVSWVFLKAVLQHMGLGPIMVDRIFSLYHYPQAQIRVNGSLSDPFAIRNGTRQGCPLSPILYVMVMEHLLQAIRKN